MTTPTLEETPRVYSPNPSSHPPIQAGTSPKSSGRIVGIVALLGAIGFAGFVGLRVKASLAKRDALVNERTAAQASASIKAPIAVIHGAGTTFLPRIEVTGTLQPWRSADVGFEQQGRLASVLVSTGDRVKSGQALAFLDAAIAGAQVNQAEAQTRAAEAQLALAEDNLNRTESLIASKSIPDAQAVQARQQVALAKAQLEGARANERLSRTGAGQRSINAPFTGLVTKAPTAAGGIVSPLVPLIHIEDHSRFRLSTTVGEDDADLVKLGMIATVNYHDRTVAGRVATLVPSLDQATRRAPIEIEVPNDESNPIWAWSFIRATIDSGKEVSGLKLPATVRRPGTQSELVVVKDGKLHFVRVSHSTAADGSWVVRDGLTPEDQVVVSPDSESKEGDAALHVEEVK